MICTKCGRYPFCENIDKTKVYCDNFIKRKLGVSIKIIENENGDKND